MGNLIFCTNSRYAPHLAVLIYSILCNSKLPLTFYVLYSSLDQQSENILRNVVESFDRAEERSVKIVFVKADIEQILKDKNLQLKPFRDSYDTYTRFFLTELLKPYNLKKAIYLDVDMICRQDIAVMFSALENISTFGGVLDTVSLGLDYYYLTPSYVNVGMLMLDFDYLERINFSQRCVDFINNCDMDKLTCNDQDVINNIIPEEDLVLVDQSFNEYLHSKSAVKKAVILHYTGPGKPWMKHIRWRLKKVCWLTYYISTAAFLHGFQIGKTGRSAIFHFLSLVRGIINFYLSLKELIVGRKP